MAATPKRNRKWLIGPIVCLVVYLLNLVLVLVFQGLFVYTIPALEETDGRAEPDLSNAAFFADCEILDIESCDSAYYVLYKTLAGEVKLVKLERNLYFDRYTIRKRSIETVPAISGTQVLKKIYLVEIDEIGIVNQTDIEYVRSSGMVFQTMAQGRHKGIAIVMLLVEAGVYELLKKRRSAR